MKIRIRSSIMRFTALLFMAAFGLTTQVFAQDRVIPQSNTQIQLSFAPLVQQVAPAVVNIYTTRLVSQSFRHPFLDDPFFGQFFRSPGMGQRMRKRVENSLGSGVIVQQDGLVVTNAHVIEGADEITVVLTDGREFQAELALEDRASDLALLRITLEEGQTLPYASLRPSETLNVGDLVLAIGNPFGVGQTVTSGIVSAQGRSSLNISDFNFFIQTDAAINPGNSGGPLVALDGGVVGINTAIYSRDGGSLGLGFAVPSEMVATVIAAEKMGRSGEDGVQRPWLGVSAQAVTSDIAQSLGLDRPKGALIAQLHPASPLKEAGLRQGDVVSAIDGREIRDPAEMKFRMATVPLGQTALVAYSRNNRDFSAEVMAIAPPNDPPANETRLTGSHPLNGAIVANLNPAVSIQLGLANEEGVVVLDVESRSAARRLLRPGDILREINGENIEEIDDIEGGLNRRNRRGFEIVFVRNGQVRQVLIR